MRLLFVTPARPDGAIGGREQLSALHRHALSGVLGSDFHVIPLRQADGPIARKLRGEIDGVSGASIVKILDMIDRDRINTLWLDGTNLGLIAKAVAEGRPHVRIISFAHNVEADFFAASLRRAPSPRAAAVQWANRTAERAAARYSDDLVALNSRDSDRFFARYGRSANALLPIALTDRDGPIVAQADHPRPYVLFVGGSFFANREGIRWFAANVSPALHVDTLVVGRGMDELRSELERFPSVRIIGPANNLAPWYGGAVAVIAPIFSGSGMKTKVAEAWMFGKSVIGTAEVFVGYDVPDSCRVCTSASEFVTAINAIDQQRMIDPDHQLRARYERDHSPAALAMGLVQILRVGS